MITQVHKNKRAILFPGPSDKTILFLTGFPKYPDRNKFIDKLCSFGFNVLMPLYTGTFDSSGDFSVNDSIDDVLEWYEYLIQGDLFMGIKANLKKIDPNNISIFSMSYGSYITDLAFRKHKIDGLNKVVFLSPLYKPGLFKSPETEEIADITSKIVERNFPFSYRFDDKTAFFNEISGKTINKLSKLAIKTNMKSPLVVAGEDDNITPPAMAKKLSENYPETNLNIIKGGHSSRIDQNDFCILLKKYIT